ncbi:TIGR00701 family protein [Coxiella burnetii]|uniref:CopD family protein n=1 Tax=Coxiella burnetii TaxID=777 RepID=UPI000B950D3D|nr:CopD family protein [Coxiella burnetii]OYK81173.1 TIGR00701 family protein [Coxiella burnetii]
MSWILALHIIFVVCWFAGLFYLPRLFVYHAETTDTISNARFKIMERKLFFGIMTPSGILATVFGAWLLVAHWSWFVQQNWMYYKLALAGLLWIYHFMCGKYLFAFKHDRNPHSHRFYRWFNEVPLVLLFLIVILVIVKP